MKTSNKSMSKHLSLHKTQLLFTKFSSHIIDFIDPEISSLSGTSLNLTTSTIWSIKVSRILIIHPLWP